MTEIAAAASSATASPAAVPAPTIGRIVHYRLSAHDVKLINGWRDDARAYSSVLDAQAKGAQRHYGTTVAEGDIVALMVTKVWHIVDDIGEQWMVNGQLTLDGNDGLWVTSVKQGDGPCSWSWPARV